jgi:hypothetical protein
MIGRGGGKKEGRKEAIIGVVAKKEKGAAKEFAAADRIELGVHET